MMEHEPVMLQEVIHGLNIQPQGTYLDLTIGRGGHAAKIYERLTTGRLLGFDQDAAAISALKEMMVSRPGLSIYHQNFQSFPQILASLDIDRVDGILLDLGVSSPQFDVAERGFSYRLDGPLDMRMDQRQSLTAGQLLLESDVRTLTTIFRDYADETFAYPIAKAIVETRIHHPLERTLELVELIKRVKPKKALLKKGHPAKQVFQALRIAVNQEFAVLEATLKHATSALNSGGRLAVISFHSGEDRLVKRYFQHLTVQEGGRRGLKAYLPNALIEFRKIKPYPMLPTPAEITRNHRSESAVLRIIEKI
jgi:16S rRNA (cytosine1402-N4)-methyltransferase